MMDDKQKKLVRELAKGAMTGQKDSLEKLLDYYMKDILYFATLHSNGQEAEDIAQTVALTVCEKIHTLSKPDCFVTWLSVIVRNTSIQHMRKAHKSSGDVDLEVYMEQNAEKFHGKNMEFLPERYVENAEFREIIVKEINQLPKNQRLCLAYYYLHELKRSEIAEVTGLTPRQVSTGLNYGKQTLKEKLEKRFGTSFVYSVAPVGTIPALAMVFRADQEVLISQELCEQVMRNVVDQLATMHVIPSKGTYTSPVTLACAATAVVVCGVMVGSVFYGREDAIPEIVSPPVQEMVQESYPEVPHVEEMPVMEEVEEEREIRTVADMIGQEEAERLESFVDSVRDPEEWQQFIVHIGAEEDRVASEPSYTYTTYILEKQNKRLLLAMQEAPDGQIRVTYLFGDREEPMVSMARIVLNFRD